MPRPEAQLRLDLNRLLAAALEAVEPASLVQRWLASRQELSQEGPVHIVAVGKAAPAMARGAQQVLGDRAGHRLLIAPAAMPAHVPGFEVLTGSHPLPDSSSVVAGRRLLETVAAVGPAEWLLVLLSGGASSLATVPVQGVSLEALQQVTGLVTAAGGSIDELNAVRRPLDRIKGGGLARAAAHARTVGLALSDVVGDDPGTIASGPLTPVCDGPERGRTALQGLGIWEEVPLPVRQALQGPSGRRAGAAPEWHLLAGGTTAVQAAERLAADLGYRVEPGSLATVGVAREVGQQLGRSLCQWTGPACRVTAGETTVRVVGSGHGGRNQEVALGAATELAGLPAALLASVGTDGIDGPTDAAGALATGTTLARCGQLGLNPARALADNDAYPLLAALGDLIVTGPTGTNVADLQFSLVG